MKDIKSIVADMEKMYPSTKRAKIFYNLHIGESIVKLDNTETELMKTSQLYINNYGYFFVGDKLFHQPDAFIIGSIK